jgi:serine/threonine protein kinase/Tol biopolymer transport system component
MPSLARQQQVSELYHAALLLEPPARTPFLQRHCGSDDELRAEVSSLLAYDAAAADFLEHSPVGANPSRPAASIGSRIGPYQVVGHLGAGGMGEVYRARDARLDRDVALKMLPAAVTTDADRRRRLDREARTLAGLNHPNIAAIYGVEESAGNRALVLELVEGQTLHERIHGSVGGPLEPGPDARPWERARRAPVTVREALGIADQIADALGAAHEQSVIHRDLKPANVMISSRGAVKVLDFGLARALHGEPTAVDIRRLDPVRSAAIAGTAPYMSPEQVMGRSTDPRSDIWAFGCVLYEMLAGRPAFAGADVGETLRRILDGVPDYSALPGAVPWRVRRLVTRCLERQPDRRQPDFRSVQREIAESLLDLEDAPVADAARAGLSRRGAVVLGVTACAVIALVSSVWSSSPAALLPQTVVPLTSLKGHENYLSFSPDASRFAFSWEGDDVGHEGVYVQQVGVERAVRLTRPAGRDLSPVWSPRADLIAFVRQDDVRSGLYVVSATGAAERRLIDYASAGQHTCLGGCCLNRVIAWSPDGRWLVLSGAVIAGRAGTFAVPVDGGAPRLLVEMALPLIRDHVSPTVSPHGDALAYGACSGEFSCFVEVVPLDQQFVASGRPRRLTALPRAVNGMAWMPNGRELLVAQASVWLNEFSLWRMDAFARRAPERVDVAGTAYYPALSADGRRLGFSRRTFDVNLWNVEDGRVAINPASSTHSDYDVNLSPDGTRIAFTTDRQGGASEIWIADRNGNNPTPVTQGTLSAGSPRWSPDSRLLVFDRLSEDGRAHVYVVDPRDRQPRRLTSWSYGDWLPTWSHDARWVYFDSAASGSGEVWKVPIGGGEPLRVTQHGGSVGVESLDGRLLYYRRQAAGSSRVRLIERSLASGDEREIDDVFNWAYAVAEDGVHYLRPPHDTSAPAHYDLCVWDAQAGETRVTATIAAEYMHANLTVSGDGHVAMLGGVDSANTDLMMVENFR